MRDRPPLASDRYRLRNVRASAAFARPIAVGRYVDRAHTVEFRPCFGRLSGALQPDGHVLDGAVFRFLRHERVSNHRLRLRSLKRDAHACRLRGKACVSPEGSSLAHLSYRGTRSPKHARPPTPLESQRRGRLHDCFLDLGQGQAVRQADAKMVLQLRGLAKGDQHGDRHKAALLAIQPATAPNLAEDELQRQVGDDGFRAAPASQNPAFPPPWPPLSAQRRCGRPRYVPPS